MNELTTKPRLYRLATARAGCSYFTVLYLVGCCSNLALGYYVLAILGALGGAVPLILSWWCRDAYLRGEEPVIWE